MKLTSGMRGRRACVSPTGWLGPMTRLKTPFKPWRSNTRLQIFCTAIAVSGVSDEGRQSTQSPQTAAIMRVPRPDRDREIEGADHAHDAERMPLLVHAMAGALAVHGEAVELAREADGEIGDVDHLLHLAEALGQDLAHFERDQRAQVLLVRAQLVADLAHDVAAFRAPGIMRHSRKASAALRHDGFVIGDARPCGRAPAARRWRDRGSQFAARGFGDPVAVAGAGIHRLDVQLLEDIGNDVARGKHIFILALGVGHRG